MMEEQSGLGFSYIMVPMKSPFQPNWFTDFPRLFHIRVFADYRL